MPSTGDSASSTLSTSLTQNSEVDSDSLKALAIKYSGKTIGVQLGTVFDAVINTYIPDAVVEYYNTNADMALALESGKISAYIIDEPMARLLGQTYTDQYITGEFMKSPYAYIYPKGTEKTKVLIAQMNDFIAKIQSDGTINELDSIWFGNDESLKVVNYSDLTGENGTLEYAISTTIGAPFAYLKDNSYVGYDVDMAVRFCREYGYKINITDYNVGGFFASVSTGMSDFGGTSICVTEERKESMDFSDPNYQGSVVLVTKERSETDVSEISDASDFSVLNGKSIGVISESVGKDYLEELVPNCNIVEIDTLNEMLLALEEGNIDAYLDDQPLVRVALSLYPNHHVLGVVDQSDYAFLFTKNNQQSDMLRVQLNVFINELRSDGTLNEIDSIWFGDDESVKNIDYNSLTGVNGTIKMAVCTAVGEPFVYKKNNNICGYEADIAYRFCKENGYKLEFVDTDFGNIFSLVDSGECIMGASCITITEERQELYNFSDPDYHGGSIIVVKRVDEFDVSTISGSAKFDELDGKKIGYLSGSLYKSYIEELVSSPNIFAYSSNSEIGKALEDGVIDAYIVDQPLARILVKPYENHHVHSVIAKEEYGFAFQKNNTEYPQLRSQMNSFLKDLKTFGLLDQIDDIWFGENTSLKTVDYSVLTGENGVLRMAVVSGVGAPFIYSDGNQFIGYDIDIAIRFCEEYGYGLEIYDCDSVKSALEGVAAGNYDLAGSCITVSQDRKQLVDFSDPDYYGGVIFITKGAEVEKTSKLSDFFTSISNSFQKTFIREERWKVFASGLGITVSISVLSAIFGSAMGFGLFLVYRKEKRVINTVIDWVSRFLQMTPVVVILMIFYYLIFGKFGFEGIVVSIITFSLMFACGVVSIFNAAVKAVDPGQALAVRALGYKDTKGFIRMILPQAIPHFIPGYKSEIVGLIKNTSIVSYVAVQDLTMVTDIIRARTYEAFFPLIATAAIYFLMALLLTKLIERIEINIDPSNRKVSRILKGVKTDD